MLRSLCRAPFSGLLARASVPRTPFCFTPSRCYVMDDEDDDYSIFDDDEEAVPFSNALEDTSTPKKKVQEQKTIRREPIRRGIPSIHKKARFVTLPNVVTPKSLATSFGVRSVDVAKELISVGLDLTTMDFPLEEDLVDMIAAVYNVTVKREAKKADLIVEPDIRKVGDVVNFSKRSPIITVMGHVDHGKTTLMDSIRHTSVADGEAGGITQHISAFEVSTNGEKMTFIDTPGHAAFSKMRLRSAQVADIVILVIAADSGIQTQTEEVLQNIEEADVPFVVAINKCDRDNANPEKVMEQLMARNVMVEQKGGDVQCVKISARSGDGVEELIHAIQMQSEFDNNHLFVDKKAPAEAYVLDVVKEKGLGVSVTSLVYTGTLKIGDVFVCGTTWGKVKSIVERNGVHLKTGEVSIPLRVVGFKGDDMPQPGDELIVVKNEKFAKEVTNHRKLLLSREGHNDLITLRVEGEKRDKEELLAAARFGLSEAKQVLDDQKEAKHFIEQDDPEKTLNIMIRADVPGSIEGLESAIADIPVEKHNFSIRILSSKIGPVSETDVEAAKETNAYLVSFNNKVPHPVEVLARELSHPIHKMDIIYSVVDELVLAVEDRLPKQEKHVVVGRAEIRMSFVMNKHKKKRRKVIAGCVVESGFLARSAKYLGRVIRGDDVIYTGPVESLHHLKDSVNEVKKGQECGIRIAEWDDYTENDKIELFETFLVPTSLDWVYTKTAGETVFKKE